MMSLEGTFLKTRNPIWVHWYLASIALHYNLRKMMDMIRIGAHNQLQVSHKKESPHFTLPSKAEPYPDILLFLLFPFFCYLNLSQYNKKENKI